MAKLEQLLTGVSDAKLRAELEAEVSALKDRTRFGLVYERHLPETVIVGDTDGIKIGDHVRPRAEADGQTDYRLVALDGDRATIAPLPEGKEREVSFADLLYIRRFGDPADVGLKSVGTVRRGDDKPYHAVIDGENFHTLQLLALVYERRVDCIYIDPPYNTGAKDWTYNNRFVDGNDRYRHSKWLSMMDKRLRLAKRLLKPDGVLVVTIDEHEIHHLGMLIEQIFPSHLRYVVTDVINASGNTGTRNFGVIGEFVLFVVPDLGRDVLDQEPVDGADGDAWEMQHLRRRGGGSGYRHQRPRQFFPIFINEEARQVVEVGDWIPPDEAPDLSATNGLRPIWPIDSRGNERVWRYSVATMRRELEAGNLALGRYNAAADSWTLNVRRKKTTSRRVRTVWWESTHHAGTHGTDLLAKFLGQPGLFPFPKSIYSVRDALAAVVSSRPEALILDFFAGSGTTLHATCLLNAEDGGSRRCVLVTNNEVSPDVAKRLRREGHFKGDPEFEAHGIFEQATRPRVTAAITGLRPDGEPVEGQYTGGRAFSEGFHENVEFFRLDYLDGERVELGDCFEAVHPLLWLGAGGKAERVERGEAPFLIDEASGYAVLFDEDASRDFEEALAGCDAVTHVAFVTDSEDAYAEMVERVGAGRKTWMLYHDFLRHYRRRHR